MSLWRSSISPGLHNCISTGIRNLKRKRFGTIQRCRPERCINRDKQNKSVSGAAIYRQRGVAGYQQPFKHKAKALVDDTAMSTTTVSTTISKAKTYLAQVYIASAVYQPRSDTQDGHVSCISSAIFNFSECISGRHRRVDQCAVSTAVSKARAYPAQLYITRAIYLYINRNKSYSENIF